MDRSFFFSLPYPYGQSSISKDDFVWWLWVPIGKGFCNTCIKVSFFDIELKFRIE